MSDTIEFDAEVVEETSYGVVNELGTYHQSMTLIPIKEELVIEWVIGDEERIVEIGVWVKGKKKVVDFDGVMELPKEAVKLLKDNGYDTSEVE